jgi:hypothetical protein
MAPAAGTYYISIISNGGAGDFTVTATEGELVPAVESGSTIWGEVEGSGSNIYRLEVTEPGQLLVMVLVGNPAVDLDLRVAAYNETGDTLASLSGASSGSLESVSQVLPEPGVYEVVVTSYFAEESSSYFLTSVLENPILLGGQWAIDATASSQYGEENNSALQATGPQDTLNAGDYPTAWAPASADSGEETLELFYEHPVTPYAIDIYENNKPGAVIRVEAYNLQTDEWEVLWEGEASQPAELSRVFSPELASVDFTTDAIRLTLDSVAVPGYNEIDAVELYGRP